MTNSGRCTGRFYLLVVFGFVALHAYWNLFWQLESTTFCSCDDTRIQHGDILTSSRLSTGTTSSNAMFDAAQKRRSDVSDYGGIVPKAFEKWKYGKVPCSPPDPQWYLPKVQRSPAHQGFFLLKLMKTGGSTAAGIHLRIARSAAQKQRLGTGSSTICKTRNDHGRAVSYEYQERDRSQSFLWTVVRDPTQRAISQFFHFEVSRNKVEPTDSNFQQWIRDNHLLLHRHYLTMLAMEDVLNEATSTNPVVVANQILQDYDFIGVTERMDESAVVLQLLLGVTTGDILYLDAKASGGFDDGADQRCVYIVPSFVSPAMKAFFQSTEWRVFVATDEFLHQAVNRSLDLTIERLGRAKFDQALRQFRYAKQHIAKTCLPNTTFPCSAGGEKMKPKDRDCLWYDSGCGMSCLDRVAEELDLYTDT